MNRDDDVMAKSTLITLPDLAIQVANSHKNGGHVGLDLILS